MIRRIQNWRTKKRLDQEFEREVEAVRRMGELLGLDQDAEPVLARQQVGWYNPKALSEPFCLACLPKGMAARPMFDCSAFANRACSVCGGPLKPASQF